MNIYIKSEDSSFIIYNEETPLFGGLNDNYYIEKVDIFSLKINSLINDDDCFKISISDINMSNIYDLLLYCIDNIYGTDVGDLIRNIDSNLDYSIDSLNDFFIMSKNGVPYYCGPRNSVIVRTNDRTTYVYNRYNLKLIEKIDLTFSEDESDQILLEDVFTDITDDSVIENKFGLNYKGEWNSKDNIPDLLDPDLDINVNDYYKVSVKGNFEISGVTDWEINDWIIYLGDGEFEKLDQSNKVLSVNGKTGHIVLTSDDILIEDGGDKNFISNTDLIYLTVLTNSEETDLHTHSYNNLTNLPKIDDIEDGEVYTKLSIENKDKLDTIETDADVNNINDVNASNLTSGLETVLHKHDYLKLLNLPFIPSNLNDLIGNLDDIDDGLVYKKTNNNFTNTEKNKLSNIEDGAEKNPSTSEIKSLYESNPDTNAFTDNEKSKLTSIEDNAEKNPSTSEIKASYESNDDTNAFTDLEKTKLSNIEDNAEKNPSNSEIKTSYEDNPDTNAFTDLEKTKLSNIEDNATQDQTGEEIKALYEAETDTNAFTDNEKSKLAGIETGAEKNPSISEIKTSYENNLNTNAFTDDEKTKLSNIEDDAEKNPSASEIKASYESNDNTNTFTDDEKTKLSNVEDNAEKNPSASEIKASYESNDNTNAFTDLEKNKLSNIEYNATSDQTSEEIKALYEDNTDTNAFTDLEKNKLSNIEDNATSDQTSEEIKTLYESNDDTNAFTDAEKNKLNNIEVGAEKNLTGLEIKTLYESNDNTNAFTDDDKSKLDSLETSKYLGTYTSLVQLVEAHPTPLIGSYAHIDGGLGEDVSVYIWDNTDSEYVKQISDIATETSASIKTKYENNLDTNNFSDSYKNKLDNIEDEAEKNPSTSEIKVSYESNDDTNAFTDSEKNKLSNIEDNATKDQTGAEIKVLYEAETDTNAFTDLEKNKLTGIEDNATKDQTGAEIKALYEAENDTNVFTDDEKNKLSNVEDGAEKNLSNSEIKTSYELNDNTNAFTDDEKTKLSNVEDNAEKNPSNSEIKTSYELNDNTNAFTDDEKNKLSNIEDNAEKNHTSSEIKVSYESNDNTNAFTDAEKAKLTGIETGAEKNYTKEEIRDLYEDNPNTNSFTDLEKTKLSNIEDNAEKNHTSSEIKALYEAETDTNAFTDNEKAKLTGIETGAEKNHTSSEIKSLYESNNNTNTFTDLEKDKLTNIEKFAEKNHTKEEIKSLYESNNNTNVFTDLEKAKLASIDDGASAEGGHEEFDDVINDIDSIEEDSVIILNKNDDSFSLISIDELFNRRPRIISHTNISEIYENTKFEYHVDVHSIVDVVYYLENFPSGMTIDASGLIEYTGVEGDYTDIIINVESVYGNVKQSFDLKVNGPDLGSNIMHSSLNDLMLSEKFYSGNWKNHDNSKIFKKPSSSSRPVEQKNDAEIKGKSCVYFDGVNDYIRQNGSYNKNVRSVIIVFKPEMGYNYGQIFGDFSDDFHISLNNLSDLQYFSFSPYGNNKAKYTLNGTDFSSYVSSSNQFRWINNQWNKIYVEYENTKYIKNMTVGSLYPDYSLGQYEYQGKIAMIAIYDEALTEDELEQAFNWIDDEYGI